MTRGRRRAGRRGRGSSSGHESNERWLLTYSDMITLLLALFIVLFSISSVNKAKLKEVHDSLQAALSVNVLPGGKSIAQSGSSSSSTPTPSAASVPPIMPASAQSILQAASLREVSEFARLKRELDAYAASHGFSSSVQTIIEKRGLVVRVLTDHLLFGSGQATLIPQAFPLLEEIAQLLNVNQVHPISVDGNTDDIPIRSSLYPSNWELSTARASTVVRFLISKGIDPKRLSATGYADQRPIASNATPQGRARNRRVEIVVQRLYQTQKP